MTDTARKDPLAATSGQAKNEHLRQVRLRNRKKSPTGVEREKVRIAHVQGKDPPPAETSS
ncbi:MAG TPA: hypothetical protein VMG81_00680 [Thermoplasmata archaeon]|nr:hypothetical protein [Thermoplasmata archaeon]